MCHGWICFGKRNTFRRQLLRIWHDTGIVRQYCVGTPVIGHAEFMRLDKLPGSGL